jgi:hypothetical protein
MKQPESEYKNRQGGGITVKLGAKTAVKRQNRSV